MPGLAAVVLWWAGRGPGLVVVLGATLAILVLGLLAPATAERFDAALRRGARLAGAAVSHVLATLGWVLVLLPWWALSRLVGYSPLEHGWATERSAWNAADLGQRRDPQRRPLRADRSGSGEGAPGPTPARRRWWRRLVLGGAVLAVAVVALVLVGTPVRNRLSSAIDLRTPALEDGPVTFAGLPVDDYAHEDEPFATDLFRELIDASSRLRPDPVVGVRNPDEYQGSLVNIVNQRRATYTPADPELDVWFFGGSTMFGIGQRDDHTIPSVVTRLAEADGIRIRATNFGVNGDVNWQETIRFAEALGATSTGPDLVVFYDGWNDESLGQYRAEIGSLDPSVSERLPFSDLDRAREPVILGGRERLEPGPEQVALGIPLAAEQYARGVRTARALGAAEGIEVAHFWQPIAAVKQYTPSDDELLERTGLQARFRDQRAAEYAALRERSGVDPIDLSTVLDGVDQPVYFDQGHTNELGARIVGDAMYRQLRPALERLRGQ